MFYLIEIEFLGPNARRQKGRRTHMVRVLTEPARTNMSLEEKVTGYLGTTDDWYQYALGEYPTAEAAAKFLRQEYNLKVKPKQITQGKEFFI